MSGGFGHIFGQPRKQPKETWISEYLGVFKRWHVEILKDIQQEHKHTIGIEIIPNSSAGIFTIDYRVTLFVPKTAPEKLAWAKSQFAKRIKELSDAQKAMETYVMNTAPKTDLSEHPENNYKGPDPLLAWYPVSPVSQVPASSPALSIQSGLTTALPLPRGVYLGLRAQMRIAEGRDPLGFD